MFTRSISHSSPTRCHAYRHHGQIAPLGGTDEGGGPPAVDEQTVGSTVQQREHALEMAIVRGLHQRCPAVHVLGVHVTPLRGEGLN